MANSLIRLRIVKTTACRGRVLIPGEELVVDARIADKLIERGLASVVGEEAMLDDDLADMTIEELKEYASEAEIDLTGRTKKADIIAAIREAM